MNMLSSHQCLCGRIRQQKVPTKRLFLSSTSSNSALGKPETHALYFSEDFGEIDLTEVSVVPDLTYASCYDCMWGCGGRALCFLNTVISLRRSVSFSLWPLYHWGNSPKYQSDIRLWEHQYMEGRFEEEKDSLQRNLDYSFQRLVQSLFWLRGKSRAILNTVENQLWI
jgi:hypothetical protein